MPVDLPLWADWLLGLSLVAGAVTTIAKMWTGVAMPYLVRPVSKAVAEAVATGLDRVVDEHLVPIKAELRTNGGTSLKDAVLRIEKEQEAARRLQEALSDYTHQNFHHIINHLAVLQQADPALQVLRDRLADAETTGEMKQVLRDELPDVVDDEGSY